MNAYEFGQAHARWLSLVTEDGCTDADVEGCEAEFDALEDVGTRSPREYLLDLCADDVVEAAHLLIQGKREDAMAAFSGLIDKARAKYLNHHLQDFVDEKREADAADAREAYADHMEDR